jgi:hypothetical protein
MTETNGTVDLARVAEILNARGVEAFVEQTGGNVATLFAGPERDGPDDWGKVRSAACGPGWFEGPDWTLPRADWAELNVGVDDPYGESPNEYLVGPIGEEGVADAVERYVGIAAA